jgi:hypothetical protein
VRLLFTFKYAGMSNTTITRQRVQLLRGELFHMILFSMAWILIGEYLLHFRDYAFGAALTLVVVIALAFYSIKLYDLEDKLQQADVAAKEARTVRLYALILLFEGVAVLVTWVILLNRGYDQWVIAAFAAIAGLHFFPLARVIRLRSYYALGIWICGLSVTGYLLMNGGTLKPDTANTFIAYGCAAGALADGIAIVLKARKRLTENRATAG